jgi:thiamine biosynthesis protein ThiS
MIVMLNGTRTSVGQGITVADLLAEHGIARERVAVEVNLVVIDRNAFERTTLHDGDRVEVVSFVGGGYG